MKEPTWNELIEEYKGTLKELQVIQFRMRICSNNGKFWQTQSQLPLSIIHQDIRRKK